MAQTQYVHLVSETEISYPKASDFPGVVNPLHHDSLMRKNGNYPLKGKPDEISGKVLVLDRFSFHEETEMRKETWYNDPDTHEPFTVIDYEEDPETKERREVGSHIEPRVLEREKDVSYITVDEYHYEDVLPSIDEVRSAKLAGLDEWDNAELPDLGVNWFVVVYGGQQIPLWIKKADRAALMLTLQAAEAEERESISVWANGYEIPVPTAVGKTMLLTIESYASTCYVVTAQHRKNIMECTDVKELEVYDFKTGYPEHPKFEL